MICTQEVLNGQQWTRKRGQPSTECCESQDRKDLYGLFIHTTTDFASSDSNE
jgi:hypothetical protein